MWENQIKTVLLLGLLTGLLIAVGGLFGGVNGLLIGLIIALAMNFFSFWFSDKIVLMMYSAKEVTAKQAPRLHKLIDEVAKKAGIPKPKVYHIASMTPNAFATGRSPSHAAIAATDGILQLLDDEELKGVLAHEASHIKNRDTLVATIAAAIAGVISFVASMARWGAIFGGGRDSDNNGPNIFEFLVLGIVTPFLALLIQLAISRSREYLADETGARMIKDPHALARALKKLEAGKHHAPFHGSPTGASLFIVNPFVGKSFFALLSTHPPTEERVRRLHSLKM